MGRRGKEFRKDDNNTGKETKLSTDESPPKNTSNVVVVKSCVINIDRNCWLLAEEALYKSGTVIDKSICGSTSVDISVPKDESKSVKLGSETIDEKKELKGESKKKSLKRKPIIKTRNISLRRSPRQLRSNHKTKDPVVRRRKETQKKVSRALGSVRRHCASSAKSPAVPRRKSLRIKNTSSTSRLSTQKLQTSPKMPLFKNTETMEKHDMDELDGSNCDDSSNHDTSNHDDEPSNEDILKEDSDDDPPMQVLERQDRVDQDPEEEDDDDNDDANSFNLANDTDEESLLLSPSALPASCLFRSPSRKKSTDQKPQKQEPVVNFSSFRFQSPERSDSPEPSTSSGSSSRYREKRGRGRPRKPIEDVKSVSGKLYRRKMAERLIDAQGSSNQSTRPQAHGSSSSISTFSQSVLASNFEDADEEDDDDEDMMDDSDGAPNYQTRLKRWDNKSTFVYAKHKFVSNENKFRCDTCQVSFTALSSLKRHYGTIYHKQQEAAGGNTTLDLSDILRPDRHDEMPSTSIDLTSITFSDPLSSSLLTNRRGQSWNRPGEQARTSSFVRRNAVDSIKKKYNAAADARRRKENSSMTTSTIASWYQTKEQQRKRKQMSSNHSTNFWFMEGDSSDDDDILLHRYEEEEDIENNFPNDDLSNDNPEYTLSEPKRWLSNSWKGNGSPHFSCEVCGESFFKKLEFTAHIFNHRQEEQTAEFFTCADCDTKCSNEDSLDVHCRLFVHSGSIVEARSKKFTCETCGSIFPRREYFERHILTHRKPLLRCPHCPMYFEYKFYLTDHIKADHEGSPVANIPMILTTTSNGKPKVELLSSISLQLLAENSSRNRVSETTEHTTTTTPPAATTVTTTNNNKTADLPAKKVTKSETKSVPEYITCAENGDESSRFSFGSCEPPGSPPISNKGLSLMQKFLESQNTHDHTYSEDVIAIPESSSLVNRSKVKVVRNDSSIVNGTSVTTKNGNQELVIQFEPDKQPIFSQEFLSGAGVESNTIFSPLTIEIPRDPSSDDKEGPEELEESSSSVNNPGCIKAFDLKSRIITNHSSNNSMQLGGLLLGCGAKCALPEKIPENFLTCQDCGKTFEHRKSLVKHVQYYRQNEEYSCLICNKSFRLKHHVSRHMKSFHNIDTNSTTSSTSGDQQGDGEDLIAENPMSSPGGSSGGLLAIPSTSKKKVAAAGTSSGSSFMRQFSSGNGEDFRKRKFSSVKSALTKMRSLKSVRSKSSSATRTMGSFENGNVLAKTSVVQRGSSVDALTTSSTKKKKPGMLPVRPTSSTAARDRILELNPEEAYITVYDSNGAAAYKCLLCKKLYPSKHRLNSHLWYHKRTPMFKCNTCGAEFKFKHDLNAHKQVHKSDRIKFSCDKCPKAFSWRKDLLKHTRTKHNDDVVAAATTTTSSATFSRGASLSIMEDLSRCPFCTLVFPQDVDLSIHISESHGKCFVCGKCKQVLGSQELLDEHMEQEHDDSHPPTPSPPPSPINMDRFNEEAEDENGPSSPEFELPELN